LSRTETVAALPPVGRRLPLSLTILATYRCTAACKDCCFGSNPFIQGEIPLERILGYIDQAAKMRTIKLVVFSGGEAFTLGKKLDAAVARCASHGMLTRIVSNSYWASTEEFAVRRLSELKAAGLTELNASTGDYHQHFVPVKNVVNASLAALSLGMPMCVMVESRLGRKFSQENLYSDPRLANALEDPRKKRIFKVVESPWMSNFDTEKTPQRKALLINRKTVNMRRGCKSVIQNIVITPSEKLGACCGLPREQIPELNVGSLKEKTMEELYDEVSSDFMKIWLYIEGPEHILAWAGRIDPTIEWEDRYAHQCDACRAVYHDPKVRKVIREHYQEKMPDILLRFSMIHKGDLRHMEGDPVDEPVLLEETPSLA